MKKKKSNQSNRPRNPQENEVAGLNRNWNKINPQIPGVRIVRKDEPSPIKQMMGVEAIKVYSVFMEIIDKSVTSKRV